MKRYLLIFGCAILGMVSCTTDEDPVQEIPDFVYAGGETTIFDVTSNAYSTPAPNLSAANFERHLESDLAFDQIFVTPPSDINPGLGPVFNNNSCVSCHVRNGRSLPSDDGNSLSGFLIRMSIPGENEVGGPNPVPFFGSQLQNRAIYGHEREGNFTTEAVHKFIEFLDGSTTTISRPEYSIIDTYHPLPEGVMISPRVAPSVYGLGLVEAISESDILAHADPDDLDGDGISGKANRVWNFEKGQLTLGRFGWKAENPTGLQQTADAYHQDMGITNSLFTEESCASQPNCIDSEVLDITDESLESTAFYFQSLAVPAVRNYTTEEFKNGKSIFETIQCASCHNPSFTTSNGIIPEVSNQKIYPYSDFLLHDMGHELSDNRPSFSAEGNEWRTPPLWGLGLLPVVNGHLQLMHDGRANGIEEAILWHGGEAENAKQEYLKLSAEDRADLVYFVRSI